jgi:hypothetical protein
LMLSMVTVFFVMMALLISVFMFVVMEMDCEVCGKSLKKWFIKEGKKVCGHCFRK